VKAQLGPKTHWHDSDDLAMMFQGTYKSEFYRAVRDLLHDEVSLQTSGAQAPDEEGVRDARTLIAQRWQELLSQEMEYRS